MAANYKMAAENVLEKKQIIDSVTEYKLYPEFVPEHNNEERMEYLSFLGAQCVHAAKELTCGYIWNNDKFNLTVQANETGCKEDLPACLVGRTNVKGNIEDEWLIVNICFELTKRIRGLVISIQDEDGQFLLIEAAEYIPTWLRPENSDNRIFIYGGEVHIVPIPSHPGEVTLYPAGTPSVGVAVELVRSQAHPTKCSNHVQQVISKRMGKLSQKVVSLMHTAHCYLPLPAAHVLAHKPHLISHAVHALCERDPLDMKACRTLSLFPPDDCVKTAVRFSKLLYAMLIREPFAPPKNSGFILPSRSHSDFKSYELGMKVAYGLEILASQGIPTPPTKEVNYKRHPKWPRFLQTLKEKTYFRNEIEGSKLYQTLLNSAKDFFISQLLSEKGDSSCDVLPSIGMEIHELLENVPIKKEEYKNKEVYLAPEDDDHWLEVSSEELDSLLAEYSSKSMEQVNTAESSHLDSLVHGMKVFVDKVSSHEGAEFPQSESNSGSGEISFDSEGFITGMKRLLHKLESDQSSSCSGSEDALSENGEDNELLEVMKDMDAELNLTEVGRSFAKVSQNEVGEVENDETLEPVDIDFNLVSNILESYSTQLGEAGPASNILGSMGIRLPPPTVQPETSQDD